MSLWMGGQTSGGDTLVTCADFISLSPAAGFNFRKAMPDSNNILQLPAFDHSYLSVYQDSAKGWQVKQYNLMRMIMPTAYCFTKLNITASTAR